MKQLIDKEKLLNNIETAILQHDNVTIGEIYLIVENMPCETEIDTEEKLP